MPGSEHTEQTVDAFWLAALVHEDFHACEALTAMTPDLASRLEARYNALRAASSEERKRFFKHVAQRFRSESTPSEPAPWDA